MKRMFNRAQEVGTDEKFIQGMAGRPLLTERKELESQSVFC